MPQNISVWNFPLRETEIQLSHLDFYRLLPQCVHGPRGTALPTGLWKLQRLVNSAGEKRERFPATGPHVTHHLTAIIYDALPPDELSIKSVFILWQTVYICVVLLCGTLEPDAMESISIWKMIFCTDWLWGWCFQGLIETLKQRSDKAAT